MSANTDAHDWVNYLHKRPEILGWFYPPDPLLLATILSHQRRAGVKGDILEIGTYAGKSAILLGFGLRPDETLHVCDPFVFPRLGNDPQRGVAHFLANYRRFHTAPPHIFVGLSQDFPREDKSYRLVHIDGSHLFNDVTEDIQIARDLCVDGSVIVMDDYSNPAWPGIAAATWAAVERRELAPLCLSPNKLYASVEQKTAAELREALVAALADVPNVTVEREDM